MNHRFIYRIIPLFQIALCISILIGCGLPDFAVLEKPTPITDPGTSTALGFTTPTDDTGISGYALYYKVYSGDTDYDDLDDSYFFDENNYINTSEELQPGNVVPLQQGFVLAGYLGDEILPVSRYTIEHTGPTVDILIDFNANDATDSNSRDEPIVGLGPLPILAPSYTLARGYIDPFEGNGELRRFVNDWYFSSSPSDFHDGDLRRPPSPQPGSLLTDFTGTPIISSDTSHTKLIIAFVTHSVGFDPGGNLSPLDSKPIFLGSVEYTDINRNNSRSTEL